MQKCPHTDRRADRQTDSSSFFSLSFFSLTGMYFIAFFLSLLFSPSNCFLNHRAFLFLSHSIYLHLSLSLSFPSCILCPSSPQLGSFLPPMSSLTHSSPQLSPSHSPHSSPQPASFPCIRSLTHLRSFLPLIRHTYSRSLQAFPVFARSLISAGWKRCGWSA